MSGQKQGHTPGPWRVELFQREGAPWGLITNGDTIIAEIRGRIDACGNGENARLIAAAPELLKALTALVYEDSDKSETERTADHVLARLAIARATGANS